MSKLSYWKSLTLALVLLAPLSNVACGKTVGETIDDATITTRVKTAMLNDPAVGGLRIDVDFERERSTTVMIEFPDRAIAPRTYEAALEAVNLPSGPPPDLVTRDSREWHNLQGYFVRVIAAYPALDRIETIILSVHPLP